MPRSFVLGTANLGMAYGATNTGEYDEGISRKVIEYALSQGIRQFDTAPGYGLAENLLGDITKNFTDTKITTKIPKLAEYTFETIMGSLKQSLHTLGIDCAEGLLFHDPDILDKNLENSINHRILETGLVKKIGFSSYSEAEIIRAKELQKEWTLFHVPENILNRSSYNSSLLTELHQSGNEILVRSVFLQGLLLTDVTEIRKNHSDLIPAIKSIQEEASRLKVRSLDLCLSYANSIPWSSGVIIAAANTNQLRELISYKFIDLEYSNFPQVPSRELDPRYWQ